MKRTILQIVSGLSLAGTVMPSVFYLAGRMSLETSKWVLLLATIGWFLSAPWWIGRAPKDAELVI